MKVCVNVRCLSDRITGIERYLMETLIRMCEHAPSYGLSIEGLCSVGERPPQPELSELAVHELEGGGARFLRHARAYLREQGALYVNMSGGLALNRGITVVHDARPAVFKEFDPRADRMRFKAAVAYARKNASHIVTVSEFSRSELVNKLRIPLERISVIPDAWEHMTRVESDDKYFASIPDLLDREYYYTLGSLAPHKNLAWVFDVAKEHPQSVFVVSGKRWHASSTQFPDLPNVRYAGYVTDAQNKTLMTHCKAYLHPSFYEGFGLPPLEAASCGVPLVVSTAGSLPEVFGKSAAYVDPHNTRVNLDMLLEHTYGRAVAQGHARPDHSALLARYSWDESARMWLELLSAHIPNH
ncbi:MAG: glycosyltransferase family 4 protein [Atopobiaceae bacterium]|nr:glycosyltransferase family 4 protein [Atopobiaceae bacterium]